VIGLREHVRRMSGYAPGEQINSPGVVKLNTNENPYPPSPRVIEAIQASLTGDNLRRYPQPLGDDFRRAAGQTLGVDPDCILIGNGSDDVLTILTRAFVPEGGLIVAPTPSYSLYNTLAQLQNARFETVAFSEEWTLPEVWPFPDANLTLLANPNSPSGTMLPRASIERLASQLKGPLILDEAYSDFADENGLALLNEVPNLIITRSFSKFYSLAGLRFGFAVTDAATVHQLVKVKDSYNCDLLSLSAATAAILDQDYALANRQRILATRLRLENELPSLGFTLTRSQANFVWCRHPHPVKPMYEALKTQNILIRFMSYLAYGEGLRISVGTDAEIDRLLAALERFL